jgi:hypothetical protein
MKIRVKEEDGFEPSTICRQLKLAANNGKTREADCANTEDVFRTIQFPPSAHFDRINAGINFNKLRLK